MPQRINYSFAHSDGTSKRFAMVPDEHYWLLAEREPFYGASTLDTTTLILTKTRLIIIFRVDGLRYSFIPYRSISAFYLTPTRSHDSSHTLRIEIIGDSEPIIINGELQALEPVVQVLGLHID